MITHSTDVEAEVDDADWKRVGPFYFYLIKQSANLLRVQKSRGRELSIFCCLSVVRGLQKKPSSSSSPPSSPTSSSQPIICNIILLTTKLFFYPFFSFVSVALFFFYRLSPIIRSKSTKFTHWHFFVISLYSTHCSSSFLCYFLLLLWLLVILFTFHFSMSHKHFLLYFFCLWKEHTQITERFYNTIAITLNNDKT